MYGWYDLIKKEQLSRTMKLHKVGLCRRLHIFFYFAQNIDCGYSLEPPHYIYTPKKNPVTQSGKNGFFFAFCICCLFMLL